MEIIGAFVIIVLVFLGLLLYSSFSWGYVASVLYQWFITPYFSELPEIYWWQFAGIMFFVNCFVHSTDMSNFKENVVDSTKGAISQLLRPWMLLFGAWLFKIILT